MKKLITILILIISINSIGQDVTGSRIIAKQSFFLRNTWIDSLRRDTIGWQNDFGSVPTSAAVYKFVNGRMGGGGSGDTSFIYSNLTWPRILLNNYSAGYYRPRLLYNLDINMSGHHFFIDSTDDFAADILTNEWAIQGNRGGNDGNWILSTPAPQSIQFFSGLTNTKFSNMTFWPDSIQIKPDKGRINIDSLRSATDTVKNKPMVWNTDNGDWSYLTYWPSGGGGGGGLTIGTTTIASGTNKYALYNNAGVLGNYAGLQIGNTNNNVLMTAQTTTDVPLNIKAASSQTANLLNISSSSGTGDLANIDKNGKLTSTYADLTNLTWNGTILQLGNTTPASTATPVTINSGATYADAVAGSKAKWKMWDNGTSADVYGLGITAGQFNFFTSSAASFVFYFAEVQKAAIDYNGNMSLVGLAGTGSRAVLADATGLLSAPVSDRSVKKNIQSLDYGTNELMNLRPVSFEYKDGWKNYGQGKQIGFIAQDIQKVLPNSVFTTPSTGKMGYNEIDLIPLLTSALQQSIIRIDKLEKEVKKLKRK